MRLHFRPDSLIDHRERTVELSAELSDLRGEIGKLLATLTISERIVVQFRFGLNSLGITYTLDEIARILKVSRERIAAIEAKALFKLRHPRRRLRLEPFARALLNDGPHHP